MKALCAFIKTRTCYAIVYLCVQSTFEIRHVGILLWVYFFVRKVDRKSVKGEAARLQE